MKTKILNMVKITIAEVEEYGHIFEEYDYIWLENKQEQLENVIGIGGNYFAIKEKDLFKDTEIKQFKDKSIRLFTEQVDTVL